MQILLQLPKVQEAFWLTFSIMKFDSVSIMIDIMIDIMTALLETKHLLHLISEGNVKLPV